MSKPSTRTVDRALTLLAWVCDHGTSTLSEAASASDIPLSTALRLMRTLESSNFLTRTTASNYQPGPRLIQLGAKAFSREMLVPLSRKPMENVVKTTGESVYLAIPGGEESAIYISIVEGTYSVRHTNWVGRTVPLDNSAVGVVLRGKTPSIGYIALENSVEEDVSAICAPVTSDNVVVAAISTLVPTYRIDEKKSQRCGEALVQAAGQISVALGQEQQE